MSVIKKLPLDTEKTANNNNSKYISFLEGFKNYLELVIGIAIILAVSFFNYLVTYNLYKKHQNNKQLILEEQKKVSELDNRLKQLENAKRLAGSIQENTALTLEAVPSQDDIPIVMSMVQKIAESSSVRVSSLSYAGLDETGYGIKPSSPNPNEKVSNTPSKPEDQQKEDTYDLFKLNIVVSGRFEDALKFLKSLENSRRLINVISFSYDLKKDNDLKTVGTNRDDLSVNLLVQSYYKDFSKSNVTEIDLDRYVKVINKLKSMDLIEIDISGVEVGKNNPFQQSEDTSSENSGADQGTSGSNFFELNTTETEEVSTRDTGVTQKNNSSSSSAEDTEAPKGDTTQVLLDLLKQEGLQ